MALVEGVDWANMGQRNANDDSAKSRAAPKSCRFAGKAPVAQWIERSPPEREVGRSNRPGRALVALLTLRGGRCRGPLAVRSWFPANPLAFRAHQFTVDKDGRAGLIASSRSAGRDPRFGFGAGRRWPGRRPGSEAEEESQGYRSRRKKALHGPSFCGG